MTHHSPSVGSEEKAYIIYISCLSILVVFGIAFARGEYERGFQSGQQQMSMTTLENCSKEALAIYNIGKQAGELSCQIQYGYPPPAFDETPTSPSGR